MSGIGLFNRAKRPAESTMYRMVTARGNGFFAWDGRVYYSDIVRSAMRPKVKAIGKMIAKHIRESVSKDGERTLQVNPEPRIRFLLEEPNPYMSGQKFQEKMAAQLILNNNAFALILRDENGLPNAIFPLPANGVEAEFLSNGELLLTFYFRNGKKFTFYYSDIIHLRQDFNEDDLFGSPIAPVLTPLMQVVSTIDQGLISAVKNSNVIQWLLKFTAVSRPEDIRKRAQEFSENYLSITNGSIGVAATDAKAEIVQVEPKNYVPNAAQMTNVKERIYSLLGTNDKIVQSDYTEDEWNAYYEAEIEPANIDFKSEYTRKIFSRRERGAGNRVVFEASNLATASMSTKLALKEMVDRGALTPNEWRGVLNYAPVPGGDQPVRRLDTAPVTEEVIEVENTD